MHNRDELRKFAIGDRVRKHSGSWWEGRVVGFYGTSQTATGYNVQLDMVPNGPVQIYPEAALEPAAALSEQTLPVRVEIKKLEWQTLAAQDRNAEVADSVLGRWEVWHFPAGKTYGMKPGEHQGTVFEDGLDEAKAHMERAYQRRMAPAIVDVPAVEPEPVAWLKLVKMTPIAGDEYQALWLTDEADAKAFPVFAHPPRSALVNAQADADVVERWQPIETAPRDGTEILLYREDCGVMLGRWIAPCEFLNDAEYTVMDEESWEDPDWFGADFVAGHRITNDGEPTEWQPLPNPPALRSSGSAEVGSATDTKGISE